MAATQPGLTAGVVSGSTSCSVPPDVTIAGAVLEYTLDDGGEVEIDRNLVFAVPPDVGTDTGTVVLPKLLFASGSHFLVRVTARNAMSTDGSFVGGVQGIASVKVSTLTYDSD